MLNFLPLSSTTLPFTNSLGHEDSIQYLFDDLAMKLGMHGGYAPGSAVGTCLDDLWCVFNVANAC